jgi:hypothetical protein
VGVGVGVGGATTGASSPPLLLPPHAASRVERAIDTPMDIARDFISLHLPRPDCMAKMKIHSRCADDFIVESEKNFQDSKCSFFFNSSVSSRNCRAPNNFLDQTIFRDSEKYAMN